MFWAIVIDGRRYEGAYNRISDAVFGALRVDDEGEMPWQHRHEPDVLSRTIHVECLDTGWKHPKHKARRVL